MSILLRSAWVYPAVGPIIRDGAVLIEGPRIAAVGPFRDLRRHGAPIDLGDSLLMPGLINAHAHLELSGIERPPLPPGGFMDWIAAIRQANQIPDDQLPAHIDRAIALGVEQSLRAGVTCIGDISRHCHLTRPALAGSPLRAVSFGEVIALGRLRSQADPAIARALNPRHASDRLRVGITPHAPYTVEPAIYRRCLERAGDAPLATHLAETQFEEPFLRGHAGPFRDLWQRIDQWDSDVPRFDGSPVEFARALGLLDAGALLAHVNYAADADLDLLAVGNASVIYCPRTHAYFQHPPHRWREMLQHGINVALGTDSCASSGDLDLLADLRLAHAQAPDLPPVELLEMVTLRAARALGMEREIGSIEPGKLADLAAFPISGDNPFAALLRSSFHPHRLWINGQPAAFAGTTETRALESG